MNTEQEIQARAARAPRVTQADIEAEIVGEHYINASQAIAAISGLAMVPPPSCDMLTICILILKNGFTVTGESSCVSPENFCPTIGQRIAREDAVRKVWPLLGFRLMDATKPRAAQWEYFYQVPACKAEFAGAHNCICWHAEGAGPLPKARRAGEIGIDLHWRKKA